MNKMQKVMALLVLAAKSSAQTFARAPSPLSSAAPTLPAGLGAVACAEEILLAYDVCNDASQLYSDACGTCQLDKIDYNGDNGIFKASCDAVSSVIRREWLKCQAECFPDPECGGLDLESQVCVFTDLFTKECVEKGGGMTRENSNDTSDAVKSARHWRMSCLLPLAFVWFGSRWV